MFFGSSEIMNCMCLHLKKKSSTHPLGASVVWHLSLPLMNRFNKAEAAIFPMQDMPSKKLNFKNIIWMSTKNRESSIQYIYIGRWVSNIDTNTAASSGRVWSYYHQLTVLWFAGMMTYAYIPLNIFDIWIFHWLTLKHTLFSRQIAMIAVGYNTDSL